MTIRKPKAKSILMTTDTFIAAVPWGDWRQVLVFRREHGGRTYIRVRTWNRHRKKRVWYPTKRFYVIPVADAEALAEAIKAAAQNAPLAKKPNWYAAREMSDRQRYEKLLATDARDAVVKSHRRVMNRRKREWV